MKKQNVRHGFRSCRLLESGVRKSDCPQKFSTLCDILPRIGIEFVHRAFARNDRHNAAGLDFIHALGEEVIVNLEVVAIVVAVRYAVSAERHVKSYPRSPLSAHLPVGIILRLSCL